MLGLGSLEALKPLKKSKQMETANKPAVGTAEVIENNEATALKVWNESIKVEVSLDMIAAKLKDSFKADNPHTNLLTNTIMGVAKTTNKLSYIYNAVNGWEDKLNFKVGQFVTTTEGSKSYHYKLAAKVEPNDPDKWEQDRSAPIIGGKVIEIDEFRDGGKIHIAYTRVDNYGKADHTDVWVNHPNLKLISEDDVNMMNIIGWDYLDKYYPNK